MSSDLQNIKSGIFWKTISTGLNALAGFLTSIVLARFLGKDSYGELILVYTVISLFMIFSNFGMQATLQRFIPLYIKMKGEEKAGSFIMISAGLGILFAAAFSAIMFITADITATKIFHNPSLALYIRWGTLYLFALSFLTNIVFSIYYGYEKWREECLLNGAYLFLSFFAVFASLAVFKGGILDIIRINAAACIMGAAGGVFYISRFMKFVRRELRFEEIASQAKEALSFSAPLFINGLLFYFITQFDKVFMGVYRPTAELAQYYVAFSIGTAVVLLIKVSETVLTPYLAKFTGSKDEIIKDKFQIIFRLFLHLSIILCIGLYFLIDPFVRFAYGPNFEIAISALKIYLIIIILRAAMTPIGIFLVNVYGKTVEIAKIGAISGIIHLILFQALIPEHGYTGALAAAIIAYVIIWLYIILAVKEIKRIVPYKSLLYAGAGCAGVVGLGCAAKALNIYNRPLLFIILPLVYLIFALLKEKISLKEIKDAI